MASKRDEAKAWKKLLAYPKGSTRLLQLEYTSYRGTTYRAYLAEAKPYGWTDVFDTPMGAVDKVIRMMEADIDESDRT